MSRTRADAKGVKDIPDALSRKQVEEKAMQAVMKRERSLARKPRDVSAEDRGYDIESSELRDRSAQVHRGQGAPCGRTIHHHHP